MRSMASWGGETQMSIEASSMFPGFRFSPTDVELISYYLKKKIDGAGKCVEIIAEIEICKYEPWDLPAKAVIKSENEWFFFSARGRKYPNGAQSKRATELGYWKATGKERSVKSGSNVIGTKRTLVFHVGRAPKGERTEWIMHEYCMHGKSQDTLVVCRLRKNTDFRLSDTSNRGSVNERHLSTTHNSSNVVAGGGIDQEGVPAEEKAAECSKKCSSSYDSYSIEQFSSASESEHKLSNDVTLAESSSHHKDSDSDEDFYADILKDDIIKLDETTLSPPPGIRPLVGSKSEAETRPAQPDEIFMSEGLPLCSIPSQGTANRRIKLNRLMLGMSEEDMVINNADKGSNSKEPPKCVLGLLSAKMGKLRLISTVFIILILLVLLVSLLGGFQQVKRIAYATMYRTSWQKM